MTTIKGTVMTFDKASRIEDRLIVVGELLTAAFQLSMMSDAAKWTESVACIVECAQEKADEALDILYEPDEAGQVAEVAA
jgi:hypothetical protein